MKHDRALRADARELYDLYNIDEDSDFYRAEAKREPGYVEAVEEAIRRREAKFEMESRALQMPLF